MGFLRHLSKLLAYLLLFFVGIGLIIVGAVIIVISATDNAFLKQLAIANNPFLDMIIGPAVGTLMVFAGLVWILATAELRKRLK